MTVVRPNSIAGINSITVQTGQALNIHDASGNLIRNITSSSGVSTFSSLRVGSGTTTSTQGISVGTGCSIVSTTVNQLELYTNNSERFRIDSGGQVQINTDGSQTASNISVGAGADLKIYHDGSDSYIRNISNTDLRIQNIGNAGIDIYNQNSYPIIFTTNGSERARITPTGSVGINTSDPNRAFTIYSDATTRMNLKCQANSTVGIEFGDPADENIGYIVYDNTDDSMSFGINAGERASIGAAGTFIPGADNTQNLGSPTKRWANLYTGDLNLCNEGSYNEIDGTSGSWTMQEGDSDLFLINRKSGKQYKFNLTEVN